MGGLPEGSRIADMAEVRYPAVAPFNASSPIGALAIEYAIAYGLPDDTLAVVTINPARSEGKRIATRLDCQPRLRVSKTALIWRTMPRSS